MNSLSTVKIAYLKIPNKSKFFKNHCYPYILEIKKYIAKTVADKKSLRSDNSLVEFWRKSEIVDFLS